MFFKYLCSLFFLFIVSVTNAQVNLEWVKIYEGPANGGESYAILTDNAGNIIAAGNNNGSSTAIDIVILKYKSNGDTAWTRRYSCGNQSDFGGLALDAEGNVYVTGFASVSGSPKCITIKYNSSGDLMWEKYYESTTDNRSIGIGVDQSGYVYIAGSALKNGTKWGIEVVKYNPVNGDTVWTSRFDQTENSIDIPYAMTVDASGNVYVTGYSQDSGIIKALLVKFNSSGVYQWSNLYYMQDVFGEIRGTAVKVDGAGNLYISGHCYSSQETFVDYLTIKYNPAGDTVWVRKYSYPAISATDEASDLAIDNDGNVYVTGRSFIGGGGSNNYDYLTIKYSPSGEQLWTAQYNGDGPTQDEARAITLDEYGNCYVTGGSSVSPLYYAADFATVKYNSQGAEVWSVRHTSYFGGYAITLGGYSNIYIAGAINADNALIKYYQDPVPVELVSFTAQCIQGNAVELKWSTATETNNSGFEIQRSGADKMWVSLAFVEGSGTTTELRNYFYKDEDVENGSYFYRLKQIDFDGTFSYSGESEVTVNPIPYTFGLSQNYPNPFNPSTTLKYIVAKSGIISIKIYDTIGNEIKTLLNEVKEPGEYEVHFDASGLGSGIYFYRMTAEGIDISKKMLFIK